MATPPCIQEIFGIMIKNGNNCPESLVTFATFFPIFYDIMVIMLKSHSNFRGIPRGKKKFYYTYDDLASILELRYSTIKKYVFERKFDPNNIESVLKFYLRRQK